MKKVFLNALKDALEENEIENIGEILKTYEERFNLGYEAGMTDEEIISMLDDVETIVAKNKIKSTDKTGSYEVDIDLACFSDFKIALSSTAGIHFDLDEDVLKHVEVEVKDHKASIKTKTKFFAKRAKYDGALLIGPDVAFSLFKVSNYSGDVDLCDIEADRVEITNISGDISGRDVKGKEATISTVSGDLNFQEVHTDVLVVSAVSGDIFIDEIVAATVKLETVSGDIKIDYAANAKYALSTISGDITIKKGDLELNQVRSSSISGNITLCGERQKDMTSRIKESLAKIKF